MRDVHSVLKFLTGGWLEAILRPGIASAWPLLVAAGASLAGSVIGGNSARQAQAGANASNERIAANANTQNWNQYLLSRGYNPGLAGVPNASAQSLAAQYPELESEWKRVQGIGDTRTFDQWLTDHMRENPGDYITQAAGGMPGAVNTFLPIWAQLDGMPAEEALLQRILQQTLASEGQPPQVNAQYQGLMNQAAGNLGRIYDGSMLASELAALDPALAARLRLGELGFERNAEMRDASGNILNTELTGLADLLGTREGAVRSIYDAELLKADTHEQAALESVQRVLAQQQAKNAHRGYSGGSSMDDLLSARTLAPAMQAGAGARADAGINLETRLGGAREADSMGRLTANSENARRLAQILDADAGINAENMNVQNALDRLQLITGDNTRRNNSTLLPGQLAAQQYGLEDMAHNAQFRDLDSALNRINSMFRGQQLSTPNPATPNIQPVMGSGQIFGSALSSAAGLGMDYFTTQSLINAMNKGTGIPNSNSPTGYTTAGGNVGVQTSWP